MANNKSNPSKSKSMQDRVEFAEDCRDSASDSVSSSSKSSSKSKSKSK